MPAYILRSLETLKHSWAMYLGIIYFLQPLTPGCIFNILGFVNLFFYKKHLCPVKIHSTLNEEIPKVHNEYGIIAMGYAMIKANYFYMTSI